MYKHVLVALDGSDGAIHALTHAVQLAKFAGARMTTVTVTEMWSALQMASEARGQSLKPTEEFEKRESHWAHQVAARAVALAQEAGVPIETVHVPDSHVAEGIVATADARNCDLIVMGSHGRRSVQRVLLGSQVARVLALTTRPVLVHR